MRKLRSVHKAVAACVIACSIFDGCAAPQAFGNGARTPLVTAATVLPPVAPAVNGPSSSIKHIVVVIQENRSFDNLFAGFPGANAPTFGYLHDGTKVPLRPVPFTTSDLAHSWSGSVVDWAKGKMNGFDLPNPVYPQQSAKAPFAYVKRDQSAPYWAMAEQYVLADHMFPTTMGPSFTAHLDLVAGTSKLTPTQAIVNSPSAFPWGCDAPSGTFTDVLTQGNTYPSDGPFPCFTQFPTIADLLDNAHISWKYYAPVVTDQGGPFWSAFDAISNVRYGPDWATHVITPQTNVLQDIAAGKLASVSYVAPDWNDSDHAGALVSGGPSWVASIVNAIGKSQYWKSTAIVILWDDWGGWYDNVPPPQLDFVGLGIRVPCIIVSPYAKPHFVSHTVYEFGSVLRFIEETFDLGSLGTSDQRAKSLSDSLDFALPPRSFRIIPAAYPMAHFLHEKPSYHVPDEE